MVNINKENSKKLRNSDEFLGSLGFSRNDIHKVFLNTFWEL